MDLSENTIIYTMSFYVYIFLLFEFYCLSFFFFKSLLTKKKSLFCLVHIFNATCSSQEDLLKQH